jgi:hypothetical protein
LPDTGVEDAERRRRRLQVAELERNPVGDFGLLAAGRDEQQVFLPVVEEPEPGRDDVGYDRCTVDRLGARGSFGLRGGLHGPMFAEIGAHLVERAGGDPGAVAKTRHQFAVVDDEPPEGGFGRLGRAAIVADFPENLVGGSNGLALVFPSPHGHLLRFFPDGIKEQPQGSVNHKRSGQNSWAYAHISTEISRGAPAIAAGDCRAASRVAPSAPAFSTGWRNG